MMPADDVGYAGAVGAYWTAGWRGVLPLKHGHKGGKNSGLPTGCTGHDGVDPSYADVVTWADQYHDGNLCLRLPDGVVGIDVDDYGAKTGAKTFAEAIARWGPLPDAPRSTSREGISGIRLFQVPPRMAFETVIAFPELGIGDVEIIQRHHRYVVSWPSIHPEGPQYRWLDEAGNTVDIPVLNDLPVLPQAWINGLKVQPRVTLDDNAIRYDIKLVMTPGDPSVVVAERLRMAIKELNLPGASRHDTCTRHVMALARMGKSGELGVEHAMRLLCDVFDACTSTDGKRAPGEAREEFIRMLTNANLARELSKPGITDWISSLVISADQRQAPENTQVDQRQTETLPGNQSTPSGGEGVDQAAAANDDTSGSVTLHDTRPRSHLEEIERGFWESRDSLRAIYQTAMARMCPPWAVLAHTAARALTMVRPHVVLPPLIGGPGSLNWFAAVVAPSGGGKGASGACSRLLVPFDIECRNVGSGEGIIAAFGRPGDDGDPSPVHEALMFTADEVDTLAAMNQRTASTTLSILRSGFSGETLGFSYAAKEKRRHIGSHTYRMTMVVSVQPTRAGWLLADGGGGTPQRFMWFPGTDSRISKKRPWESGPLMLPAVTEWQYPREIKVPDAASDLILDERVKAMQGDQDALDGHALFCREKFAYALAVLDGRIEMTLEDWELSGIVTDVSTFTRESMIEAVKDAATLDAVDRGELRGVEMEAADVAKLQRQIKRGQRVLNWLLHKLESAPEGWMGQAELMKRCAGRDESVLKAILERGHETIRGEFIDGTIRWYRK